MPYDWLVQQQKAQILPTLSTLHTLNRQVQPGSTAAPAVTALGLDSSTPPGYIATALSALRGFSQEDYFK